MKQEKLKRQPNMRRRESKCSIETTVRRRLCLAYMPLVLDLNVFCLIAEKEPAPEPEADTKAPSSPELTTEPEYKAEITTGTEFPEVETTPTAEITPEAEKQSEPAAELEPEAEPEPEVYPEANDPDKLHPMDCTDIVVGRLDQK